MRRRRPPRAQSPSARSLSSLSSSLWSQWEDLCELWLLLAGQRDEDGITVFCTRSLLFHLHMHREREEKEKRSTTERSRICRSESNSRVEKDKAKTPGSLPRNETNKDWWKPAASRVARCVRMEEFSKITNTKLEERRLQYTIEKINLKEDQAKKATASDSVSMEYSGSTCTVVGGVQAIGLGKFLQEFNVWENRGELSLTVASGMSSSSAEDQPHQAPAPASTEEHEKCRNQPSFTNNGEERTETSTTTWSDAPSDTGGSKDVKEPSRKRTSPPLLISGGSKKLTTTEDDDGPPDEIPFKKTRGDHIEGEEEEEKLKAREETRPVSVDAATTESDDDDAGFATSCYEGYLDKASAQTALDLMGFSIRFEGVTGKKTRPGTESAMIQFNTRGVLRKSRSLHLGNSKFVKKKSDQYKVGKAKDSVTGVDTSKFHDSKMEQVKSYVHSLFSSDQVNEETEQILSEDDPTNPEELGQNFFANDPQWGRFKDIKKYYYQRFRLFSKYNEGVQMDHEGWFSVTPEMIAKHTAERMCRRLLGLTRPLKDNERHPGMVIDGFSGLGGNTIQLAMRFERVVAFELNEERLAKARHNADIYGVAERVEFVLGDYMELIKKKEYKEAVAVFLSPPWGGVDYHKKPVYDISLMTSRLNGFRVFAAACAVTGNIAFYLPRNVNVDQLGTLAGKGGFVEVEQNLLNKKMKAVTAYYGELIEGADGRYTQDDEEIDW